MRLFETLCEYLLESIFNTDDIGFQYMHGRWWYVYVWISDNYGFEFFEGLKGYSVKGTLTNTLGWGLQTIASMKPYDFWLQYEYTYRWN